LLKIKDRLKHQCRIAQGEDVDEQLARLGFKAAAWTMSCSSPTAAIMGQTGAVDF